MYKRQIYPIVDKIVALKPEMEKLTDDELKDNTRKFRERLEKGETLDDILPEAFATIREASRRVLNMEHYPVQLIGGIVLHQGRICLLYTSLSVSLGDCYQPYAYPADHARHGGRGQGCIQI